MAKALSAVFRMNDTMDTVRTRQGLIALVEMINKGEIDKPGHYEIKNVHGERVGTATMVEL